jgi:hypothetical protein
MFIYLLFSSYFTLEQKMDYPGFPPPLPSPFPIPEREGEQQTEWLLLL